MPPNKPQTTLPLETFRQAINWHPFYFYQLVNELVPLTDSADLVASEYTWQRPMAASRNDFRRAIQSAEQKLCNFLNYDVSTRYRQQAVDPGYLMRLNNPAAAGYGWMGGLYGNAYGNGYSGYGARPSLVQLQVGKLQRIATVSYTALSDFAVSITDADGDGLNDTFIGTFTDTLTDPATVLVAFSTDDQVLNSATTAASAGSSPVDWQVRPVSVTRLNPNTLQVVGPSWLIVKPSLYEKAGPSSGYNSSQTGVSSSGTFDPNGDTTYVAGLAAWQKVYSNENQATFVRRFGGNEYTFQAGVTVVSADLGQVQLDLLGCFNGVPPCVPGAGTDELRICYEAGATADFAQSTYLLYQTDWDTIVSRFAIAELAQVPGATQKQNPALYYWREDLAHTGSMNNGAGDSYRISNEILNNPFRNTRRGAVEAFLAVSSLAQHRAVNF